MDTIMNPAACQDDFAELDGALARLDQQLPRCTCQHLASSHGPLDGSHPSFRDPCEHVETGGVACECRGYIRDRAEERRSRAYARSQASKR